MQGRPAGGVTGPPVGVGGGGGEGGGGQAELPPLRENCPQVLGWPESSFRLFLESHRTNPVASPHHSPTLWRSLTVSSPRLQDCTGELTRFTAETSVKS